METFTGNSLVLIIWQIESPVLNRRADDLLETSPSSFYKEPYIQGKLHSQ